MSHYATLGIKENASSTDIKQAFRKLAAEHHPDKGGDAEKFKQVNEAYQILRDDNTRQQYDAQRRMGANPFGNTFRQQRSTNPFRNGDFGDFSFTFTDDGMNAGGYDDGTFPNDIGDLFRHMTGRAPRGSSNPGQERRNKDVRVKLIITLSELLESQSKTLSITKSNGQSETLYVTVPRTTRDGTRIRYPGLGDDMFTSLPRGDLFIEIAIDKHEKFTYNNDDLHTRIEISALDAMVGGDTVIDSLDGKRFAMTIPPGTQPNTKMRIANQGLYKDNTTSNRGNLYITIDVIIPKLEGDEAINEISKLRETITREKNKL
jgi:DnaJ-class molecular chaperone